jgi:hypothetical protein
MFQQFALEVFGVRIAAGVGYKNRFRSCWADGFEINQHGVQCFLRDKPSELFLDVHAAFVGFDFDHRVDL